jgi:triacylglycerol lipase
VFNPLTPDDPRVRYFSVAGRVGGVSVWHPLWLPKMVLDGVEARTRAREREVWERGHASGEGQPDEGTPLWARENEWGNDGLVTVQSARWGEFLGTLEGADHWTMRGARGIELSVDLKAGSGGDGWTSWDWGKLVGVWRREERMAEALGEKGPRRSGGEQERVDEALVKSSTDKLSAVFDWLAEQVPTPRLSLKGRKGESRGEECGKAAGARRDLETKMDLERFYVALSRKLYDEGF